MQSVRARLWFAATAVVVLAGVVIQLFVTAGLTTGFFDTKLERTLNVFCFFTIQSNIIVGVTCLLLAMNPDRSSTAFRVFRLTGVVAITVTGIVYHSVLAGLFDLDTWGLVADHALHTVVPVMAVVGWLMFGPRGQTSFRVARQATVFPIAWMIFTLIRGAFVDFYPYPFVDVNALGYARVLVNGVWVAALYLGLAAGFTVFDGWLLRLRAALPDLSATAAGPPPRL